MTIDKKMFTIIILFKTNPCDCIDNANDNYTI